LPPLPGNAERAWPRHGIVSGRLLLGHGFPRAEGAGAPRAAQSLAARNAKPRLPAAVRPGARARRPERAGPRLRRRSHPPPVRRRPDGRAHRRARGERLRRTRPQRRLPQLHAGAHARAWREGPSPRRGAAGSARPAGPPHGPPRRLAPAGPGAHALEGADETRALRAEVQADEATVAELGTRR